MTLIIFGGIAAVIASSGGSIGGIGTPKETATPSQTPLPPNADAVGAELRMLYTDLINDAALLQQQMQVAGRGESINCELEFTQPSAVPVPAGLTEAETADLTVIADPLNEAQVSLAQLLSVFQQSCNSQTAIPREDAADYGGTIVDIQRNLNALAADISTLPEEMPTPMPVQPTATEVIATEVPTEEASPTIDVTATSEAESVESADVRAMQQELVSMQVIVDEMTSFRGGITILLQYWNDVEFTGSTLGCREIVPTIPENYVLPEGMAEAAPAVMISAVDNLNLALDLSRQAWEGFTSTCARGEAALANVVAQQKIVAVTAQSAFSDAESDINEARNVLRQ
ncbi:MAG: hypothetical protein KC546_18590 [Anaerolineae bacterium]|nr:hypothetical protein [Anaerolineae bacterium]